MRILIFGASGYLGNTIYKTLRKSNKDEIHGTCHRTGKHGLIQLDAQNSADIKSTLSLKPDIIIWSIMDQQREMRLSQTGLQEVVDGIDEDVRLIYVSTTVGKGKNQTEETIPTRRGQEEYLHEYVNGKIEGERIVQKHKNHVIVRPGSIYGFDCDGSMDSRMKTLLEMSEAGVVYRRTANMYASFIDVLDLAKAITELSYSSYIGIMNISGEQPVSHFNFNRHLAGLMNIHDGFIVPEYREEDVFHCLNNDKRKHLLQTQIRDI